MYVYCFNTATSCMQNKKIYSVPVTSQETILFELSTEHRQLGPCSKGVLRLALDQTCVTLNV